MVGSKLVHKETSPKWIQISGSSSNLSVSLCLSLPLSAFLSVSVFFLVSLWSFFPLCVLLFADQHTGTKSGSLFFTIATYDFPQLQKLIAQWNWFAIWRDFFSFFFSFFFRFFLFLLLEKIDDRSSLVFSRGGQLQESVVREGRKEGRDLRRPHQVRTRSAALRSLEYLPTHLPPLLSMSALIFWENAPYLRTTLLPGV
jgi:hypothetical protein